MATMTLQIDSELQRRAAEVLKGEGLTVEQAVEQMLTRTVDEGELPFVAIGEKEPGYDAWLEEKARRALQSSEPRLSHEEVQLRMAPLRALAMERLSK